MINIAQEDGMQQMVKETTRKESILDLCFTNSPDQIDDLQIKDGISDHDMVVVKVSTSIKQIKPTKHRIYLYKKVNFTAISHELQSFWSSVTSIQTILFR